MFVDFMYTITSLFVDDILTLMDNKSQKGLPITRTDSLYRSTY
jgi:hypothetical protein